MKKQKRAPRVFKKSAPSQTIEISDEEIEKALNACAGYQNKAAEKLKVSRGWLCNRIKQSPYLSTLKDQMIEARIDEYEIRLDELMKELDVTAIIFFLKTIGKRRGYTQDILTESNLSAIKAYMDMHRDNSDATVNVKAH